MITLLVGIVITIAFFIYLSKYKNLREDDVTVMVAGSLVFAALGALANLLVVSFTVGFTTLALGHLISLLFNGALSYYFLSKAGII